MMNFSFLIPHFKICGGNRRYLEMANRLVDRGYEVKIYSIVGDKCDWYETKFSYGLMNEFYKIQHQVLIHSYPSKDEFALVKAANANLKIFYLLHLYNKELMSGFKPKIYWHNEKTLYTKKNILSNQLIIANASWMRVWVKKNLNKEIKLLIGGVNFDIFHPVETVKNKRKIKIIYSGDNRGWKNTKLIELALDRLRKKYNNLEADSYFTKNIPQDKMSEFYSQGDIFVDAQMYGGWNNPVVEAMACGVPVVCSDIGSVKDFAWYNKTALLFENKNLEDLVEKLEILIHNKDLRDKLAKEALKVVKKFNWEESINDFIKICENNLKHESKS